MKYLQVPVILTILVSMTFTRVHAQATGHHKVNFDKQWRFHLGEVPDAMQPGADDAGWRMLDLPHDWSIEGKFDKNNPATTGGGALPGGIGWYRKTFTLPASQKDKLTFIDFDGVYMNSEVWINGHYLGKRPSGYISFRYEMTPWLHYGNEKNVIAVKVDNSHQPNSRWYSGSGIYRNVWLVFTPKTFVDHWGTFFSTPKVNDQSATVDAEIRIRRVSGPSKVDVTTRLYDQEGKIVAHVATDDVLLEDSLTPVAQQLEVAHPELWSDTRPYLYTARTELSSGNQVVDQYVTVIGIRYFTFDPDKGFLLDGRPVKIRGVCDHHDLGCLGSAVNTRALQRQLEMLKGMGCNAIRTSHNPPAPELLQLCDKMGFIVMDEAFDMWKKEKTKYDYHLYWDAWHKRDLEDQILRDRNHPSVFIWSIGNEIPEQWGSGGDTSGRVIARELAGILRGLDTSRPITSACNHPDTNNNIIVSGALDLIGYNYHQNDFPNFHTRFPGKKFIATETTSALQTRGHYDMPSDSIRRWPERWDRPFTKGNPDYTCSAYDNCSAPWGSTHEETWKIIKKYDFLSGMFIWTGWDYLGEPTPYDWPARSSYFGIIDLAGFPKDSYYMYESEWTNDTVLHIFPHWNWKKGDTVDVWAYYNHADEVELFLNGKSLGTQKKTGDDLHVMWRVPYVPGTLKAISRRDGKPVLTREIHTAGAAARIVLQPDRAAINAGGDDLSFVTVRIEDAQGNLVPDAGNLVNFTISGPGIIAGVDNGCETDHEPFKASYRKAFNGLCLAVVRSGKMKGAVKLVAASKGLASAATTIEVK